MNEFDWMVGREDLHKKYVPTGSALIALSFALGLILSIAHPLYLIYSGGGPKPGESVEAWTLAIIVKNIAIALVPFLAGVLFWRAGMKDQEDTL